MPKAAVDPQPISHTEIAGERRQVTALFYDIVGSTQLLQRSDPEDFARLQRRIHQEAAAAIAGNSGYFERLLGDGGTAYFGFPVASEDAAECAVLAALDLVARCKALDKDPGSGAPLRVRVGVATGLVVISELTGASLPGSEEVIGVTPALAARIQAEAEPNSVAVSDATYQLTSAAFKFEALGARSLKGFAEPERLWKPVARRPHSDRFSSARQLSIPLIGRADELALCRSRLARARQGQGQLVRIVGQAGIGKSRLAAELSRTLSEDECETRLFQCVFRGNTRPLYPFIDALHRSIRGESAAPGALNPQEIKASIEADGVRVSQETADVIAFLSGGGGEEADRQDSIAEASNEEARRRALDAVFEILAAWCRRKPQFLIVEDAHWADTLTQAVIAEAPERIADLPVLLLSTTREETWSTAADHPNVLTIALSPLDARSMPQLVESIWMGPPPANLPAFIYGKSDGVPLFAEELARLLKERFATGKSDANDWREALREGSIISLQDLLSARLSSLGETRRVAQVASVIGREFQTELLSRLIYGERLELSDALQKLIEAGILRRRGVGRAAAYRFRHVLLQEAAYDSLLKVDRRELHRRVADLVTSGAVPEPPLEVMSWHCEQAGRLLDAARYAIRAAEASALRSATREADRLLNSAEAYLRDCSEGPEVDELWIEFLMIRGPVGLALFGSGSPEARSVYERGVALCQRLGVTDPQRWLPLYWGWWFTSPDFGTQRARAETLIEIAEKGHEADNSEIMLQSLHCAWATDFNTGRYADCICRIDRALPFYDPQRAIRSRGRYGGHDAKVCALAERGLSLWFVGDIEHARSNVQAALDGAQQLDHPASLSHALDFALMLRRYENDFAGAAALASQWEEVADAHGLVGAQAKSQIFGGWALGMQGSLEEGLHKLEEGLAKQRATGTEEDLPVFLEMQAELLGRLSRPDKGIAVLGAAIERAERLGHMFWIPELYRRRALLRHMTGQARHLCIDDLERALAEAEGRGAKTLASRASENLAQLKSS